MWKKHIDKSLLPGFLNCAAALISHTEREDLRRPAVCCLLETPACLYLCFLMPIQDMFTKPELCVRAQYSLYVTGEILSFERADTGYLGSCVHFQLCLWRQSRMFLTRPQDVSVFVATKWGILGQIMTFIFNPSKCFLCIISTILWIRLISSGTGETINYTVNISVCLRAYQMLKQSTKIRDRI